MRPLGVRATTLVALVYLGAALAVLQGFVGSGLPIQFGASLVSHVTGSAIPVAALVDWLRGIDTPVPGWRTDLSQLAQGRVTAKRLEPTPEADLRLVLEQQ